MVWKEICKYVKISHESLKDIFPKFNIILCLSNLLYLCFLQVDLKRRDGSEVTVMQLGQPLLETLKVGSENAIHQFHKPHR